MATSPPVVSTLPAAPNRNDAPADFSTKADAFVAALPPMVTQENTLATWMYTASQEISGYANSSATNAQTATNAANSAAAIAAAVGSTAGLPSMVGNARRALAVLANEQGVAYQTQVKLIAIDPLQKSTTVTGAFALNVGTTGVFDLTLTGATTLSFTNLPALSATESMVVLLRLRQGATAYTLTYPGGMTWITPGGVAVPTPNAGKMVEVLITIEGSVITGRKGASN